MTLDQEHFKYCAVHNFVDWNSTTGLPAKSSLRTAAGDEPPPNPDDLWLPSLLLRPDWGLGVQTSISYETEIRKALAGRETRRSLVQAPFMTVSCALRVTDNQSMMALRSFLSRAAMARCLVPIWSDQTLLNTAIVGGTTSRLYSQIENRRFHIGMWLAIVEFEDSDKTNPTKIEIRKVASVTGGSSVTWDNKRINVIGNVTNNFKAGAIIYPLMECDVNPSHEITILSNKQTVASVSFRGTPGRPSLPPLNNGEKTGLKIYIREDKRRARNWKENDDGVLILQGGPHWTSDPRHKITRPGKTKKVGRGNIIQLDALAPMNGAKYSARFHDRLDYFEFAQFFSGMRGRLHTFWHATLFCDWDVLASDYSSMTVRWLGHGGTWDWNIRPWLAIWFSDGDVQIRGIESASIDVDGNYVVLFNKDIAKANYLNPGSNEIFIDRISLAFPARFAHDNLDEKWISADIVDVNFELAEVVYTNEDFVYADNSWACWRYVDSSFINVSVTCTNIIGEILPPTGCFQLPLGEVARLTRFKIDTYCPDASCWDEFEIQKWWPDDEKDAWFKILQVDFDLVSGTGSVEIGYEDITGWPCNDYDYNDIIVTLNFEVCPEGSCGCNLWLDSNNPGAESDRPLPAGDAHGALTRETMPSHETIVATTIAAYNGGDPDPQLMGANWLPSGSPYDNLNQLLAAPVHYWDFEDGGGTTATDVAGAVDISLFNVDIANWDAGSGDEIGGFFSFIASDEYGVFGPDGTLPLKHDQEWTIVCVMRSNDATGQIIGKKVGSSTDDEFNFKIASNEPRIRLGEGSTADTNVNINDGEWHFVYIINEDQGNGTFDHRISVNLSTPVEKDTNTAVNNYDYLFGAHWNATEDGAQNNIIGDFAHLQIYSETLSVMQLSKIRETLTGVIT